jgi:hypothetical protein
MLTVGNFCLTHAEKSGRFFRGAHTTCAPDIIIFASEAPLHQRRLSVVPRSATPAHLYKWGPMVLPSQRLYLDEITEAADRVTHRHSNVARQRDGLARWLGGMQTIRVVLKRICSTGLYTF